MAHPPPRKKKRFEMDTDSDDDYTEGSSSSDGDVELDAEKTTVGTQGTEHEGFDKQNLAFRSSDEELTFKRIVTAITRAETGSRDYVIISNPPVKPKAGKVFLYKKKKESDCRFLEDQYFGFKQCARKRLKCGLIKKYYQLLLRPEGPSSETGKKPERVPLPDFWKCTYELDKPSNKDTAIVMIHYFGNEKAYIHQCHGNSKKDRAFTRTSADIKERIKTLVENRDTGPKKIYENLVKDGSIPNQDRSAEECIVYEPIDTPRDLMQIKNFKKQHAKSIKISKCEIFAIYEMAKSDLKEFILKLDLVPYDVIIFAEPTTLLIANELLRYSNKKPELPQLITYDTTFELADSYVSILVMRNTFMEGDPIFPVAFMIHDRKVKEVHHAFWQTMAKKLDLSLLKNCVPICTDRESAIVKAIKEVVPGETILSCTNHIKRDVVFWLKQNGGKDDVSVISQQISVLLQCDDINQYSEILEAFKEKWSTGLVDYFQNNLEDDLIRSAKFNVQQYAAFEDCLPTNNIGESVNKVIKAHTNWKELPVDALLLKLIERQCSNLSEFFRGKRFIGKYRLKKDFTEIWKWKQPTYIHFSESEFAAAVKNSSDPEGLLCPDQHISKELRAQKCIDLKLVNLIPDQKLFVVTSPYSTDTYHIKRNPTSNSKKREFICSCNSSGLCYHVMAVQLSIDDKIGDDSLIHKLSTVKKKSRGFKTRLGRKKPNLQDLLANIEEAEDSQLATRKKLTDLDDLNIFDGDNANKTVQLNGEEGMASIPEKTAGVEKLASMTDIVTSALNDDKIDDTDEFERSFAIDCNANSPKLDHLFKQKKYHTLEASRLEGSIIDRLITALLETYGFSNVLYIEEVMYQTVCRDNSPLQVAHYSHHRGGLNKDLILVCVSSPNHWMLGAIILSSKTICLFDSVFYCENKNNRIENFRCLLKIAQGVLGTAAIDLYVSEWKLFYASDSPKQQDGTECGVIVCLMTLALLKSLPFPPFATLHKDNKIRNRRWILHTLESQKSRPEVTENQRLPPEIKTFMSENFQPIIVTSNDIKVIQCRSLVSACLHDNGSWLVCNAKDCPGDEEQSERQILCVICRNWYHLSCVNDVLANLPSYYKCTICSAKN